MLRDRGQPLQGGFREQIIAHSRTNYARPRAEVEAQINRFLRGEPLEEKEEVPTTPDEEARLLLKRQLISVGITSPEATLLLDTYPHERIRQQLEWLPLRHARNPAGFLLAAIEGDYDPPLTVRLQGLKHRGETRGITNHKAQQEELSEEPAVVTASDSETLEEESTEGESISLELPPEGAFTEVASNSPSSPLDTTVDEGQDATEQDVTVKDSP